MADDVFSIPELHDHLDPLESYPQVQVTRDQRIVPRQAWPSLSISQTLIDRALENKPSKFWFNGDVVVQKIKPKT